jgi:magnesium-transporting ATPase (P-type)
MANTVSANVAPGLTSEEAAERRGRFGLNAVKEESTHPVLALLSKFWAPVPWMLEVTLVLEFALGKHPEAAIIGALLVFNAALGFVQENRAQHALNLLRQRLSVQARVLRDGRWQLIPARDLVPGDVIHLRMGDLLPADVRLSEGEILLDQSALTGESAPVEGGPGARAYAGTVVKRGEATGEVTATGQRTYFGKTAELVRTAKTAGHLQKLIFRIVKYLVLGVILTGDLIITPLLVVLLLFTNDFVTMSIATDRVSFSKKPEKWKIRDLVMTALPFAALILALSFTIFFTARNALHLPLPQLQTLAFITLVFSGQGTVYLVRERYHFWSSRPSRWMLISSAADIMLVSLLATHGILMAAVSTRLVAGVLLVVLLYLIAVDFAKVRIFAYFSLH